MRLRDKYHKHTNETSTMKLKKHYCRVLQLHIREVPRTDHHIIQTDELRGLSHSLQTDVCLPPGHGVSSLILVHSYLQRRNSAL
jgi:hypothetical protein